MYSRRTWVFVSASCVGVVVVGPRIRAAPEFGFGRSGLDSDVVVVVVDDDDGGGGGEDDKVQSEVELQERLRDDALFPGGALGGEQRGEEGEDLSPEV